MIGTTGRVAAAAAIVLVFGLAGCAQDQNPPTTIGKRQAAQQPPPASALPRPTALPITHERSRSGAQEFAKYWFAALNYAVGTGDIGLVRTASDPGCTACVDAVTNVRTAYSDGGRIQGGTYTVRSVTSEEFGLDDRPVLALFVDRSARSGIGPDGAVRDSVPAAGFISCELTVEWTGDGWRAATLAGDLLPAA